MILPVHQITYGDKGMDIRVELENVYFVRAAQLHPDNPELPI